jgi:hypothetical protein
MPFFKEIPICLLFILFSFPHIEAQATWQFEFMPGIGKALPSPIHISQESYPDLRFWSTFETKSLRFPIYYSYRVSRYKNGKGWELEMNHLKIYAKNKPPEVENFSITHGFNSLWLNRGWDKQKFRLKAGAGVVIAHPEITVSGRQLDEKRGIDGSGYYVGGPSVHVGLQRPFELSKHWVATLEGKISLAWVSVPVNGGKARLPLVALHFLAGIGFRIN